MFTAQVYTSSAIAPLPHIFVSKCRYKAVGFLAAVVLCFVGVMVLAGTRRDERRPGEDDDDDYRCVFMLLSTHDDDDDLCLSLCAEGEQMS